MDDRLDEGEFWLPAEFLTHEDIVMDNKENLRDNNGQLSYSNYDSVVISSNSEYQLTELTRQLSLQQRPIPSHQNSEKSRRVIAETPSHVSSPPTSPLGPKTDDCDLVYEAAGEIPVVDVSFAPTRNLSDSFHHRNQSYLQNPSAFCNSCVQQVQGQQQRSSVWANRQVKNGWVYEQSPLVAQNRGVRILGFDENEETAWPPLELAKRRSQHKGSAFLGGRSGNTVNGGGVKRQFAGTGVFLPRCYGSNKNSNNRGVPAEPRKRPGCSTTWLPAKEVQTQKRNSNDTEGGLGLVQSHCQTRFTCSFVPNYGNLMARRNALLMQQRRLLQPEFAVSHEISLPQEWTY